MNFTELVLTRRSVNFFKTGVDISNDELRKIIDLAELCPSASNIQPWKLIIVKSDDSKKKLRAAGFDQPKITDASVTFILLGDTESYKKGNPTYKSFVKNKYMSADDLENYLKMIEGLYSGLHTPEQFAIRNASLFGMSLMYSAKMFGWDTHPMIGFNPGEVKKNFDIPEKYIPVMLIALGKFDTAKGLLPRNDRYSMNDIASFDMFKENNTPMFDNYFMTANNKVTLKDKTFNLAGRLAEKKSVAPDFKVIDNNLQEISITNLIDKPLIISAVPSIDTPVCSIQTKKFNDLLLKSKDKINFITISCDTPFAQKRFCTEAALEFPTYSDHKYNSFALNYGILILELRLCARAVFIINTDRKIAYTQLVTEISSEPDYNQVMTEIEKII